MHYVCQIWWLEKPDLCHPIFPQFHFAWPPVLHIMWYMNVCFTQEFWFNRNRRCISCPGKAPFSGWTIQLENHRPHLPRPHCPASAPSAYGSVNLPEPSTKFSWHPLIFSYLRISTVDGDFRVYGSGFAWARWGAKYSHPRLTGDFTQMAGLALRPASFLIKCY